MFMGGPILQKFTLEPDSAMLANGIQRPLRDKILLHPTTSSKPSTGNIKDGGLEGTPRPTRPVCKLLSYPLNLELANIQPRLGWYHSTGFKVQFQNFYHKPVVGFEELSTPVDPAVLDHPPATINEQMVDLLCHTASVGMSSPAMRLWALKP